jgi:hypothetical protein
MSNQPLPLTDFQDVDAVIEEVHNPQTAKALDDADANIMSIDELRRKLCDRTPVPQKSKWRLWYP